MATGPPPQWMTLAIEGGANVVYLQGRWRLPHVAEIAAEIAHLTLSPERRCILDGSRLEDLDTAAGFLLLRQLSDRKSVV